MELLKKINKRFVLFHLWINMSLGVFISLSSYIHVPLDNLKDYIVYLIHFILLQISLFGFTYVLTINKWVFKIVFSSLFFIISLISFWVYTMDVSVSVDLIRLSLESKPDVFLDLISWPLTIYTLLLFLIIYSFCFFYSRVKWRKVNFVPSALFALFGMALFFVLEAKKHGVFSRRMPYMFVYEATKYYEKEQVTFNNIEEDIYADNKVNIVFILGESVRAKNIQLNGYHRETTPLLNARNDVYSFKYIYTPNTYTAKSLPQVLTSKSILDTLNQPVYSIYSILNKINYNTTWIGNQTPESSFRDLVFQNNNVKLIDVEHSVLSYQKKYDEELLDLFKTSYNPTNSKFYTLHMIGSHWWYEGRYPEKFKIFSPIVKTKYLPSNTDAEMINSYDNTIVYLDYLLNDIITFLEQQNNETILIYLSDHGETLGEDGKWLHAQGNEASMNPACVFWASKQFKEKHKIVLENLEFKLDKKITTDFLYHSILDIIGIKQFKYNKNESIFVYNP